MYPIQQQGNGKGIGLSPEMFRERFDEVCEEHLAKHRASAFAFIFYDFSDRGLKRVLKDHGVFTKLDRLAGDELSIFYLNSPPSRQAVEAFNTEFQDRLGISSAGPCVVFFRIESQGISDVQARVITSKEAMHAFQELHQIVTEYLKGEPPLSSPHSKWKFIGSGLKWVSKEAITTLLKETIEKGDLLGHLKSVLRLY